MKKIGFIIITNPCLEISKEGFKSGDRVEAEFDGKGAAWFKSNLPGWNNWCVLYPGDYKLDGVK